MEKPMAIRYSVSTYSASSAEKTGCCCSFLGGVCVLRGMEGRCPKCTWIQARPQILDPEP